MISLSHNTFHNLLNIIMVIGYTNRFELDIGFVLWEHSFYFGFVEDLFDCVFELYSIAVFLDYEQVNFVSSCWWVSMQGFY